VAESRSGNPYGYSRDPEYPHPQLRRPPAGVTLAVEEGGVDLGKVEGQGAAVGRLGSSHG
jgi:hypothetical protein